MKETILTFPSLLFICLILTAGQACTFPDSRTSEKTYGNTDTVPVAQDPSIDRMFFIDGQFCQHLVSMKEDSRGDLWFGTIVYGLFRYDGETLHNYHDIEGVGSGRLISIQEDDQGVLWMASASGLTRHVLGTVDSTGTPVFDNYGKDAGLAEPETWSMLLDPSGDIILGTFSGASRFDQGSFTPLSFPKAVVADTNSILSYDRVNTLLLDKRGTYWYGMDGFGITCVHSDGRVSHFTKANGLTDNNVTALLEDSEGGIWIATMYGGISRYDPETGLFRNFTQEGLVEGVEVGALYEDKAGDIWFAAENSGIYHCDLSQLDKSDSFTNYYKDEGLETNGILCMMEDSKGRFWMGGWGCLFRFDRAQGEKTGDYFTVVTEEGPWE